MLFWRAQIKSATGRTGTTFCTGKFDMCYCYILHALWLFLAIMSSKVNKIIVVVIIIIINTIIIYAVAVVLIIAVIDNDDYYYHDYY